MLRVKSLHHIRVAVPDVATNHAFARDFGLVETGRHGECVYFRGYGPDAYSYVVEPGPAARLLAIAFLAESRAVLDEASRLPGASAVRRLEGPGGGEAVSLADPDGNGVELVYGIEPRASEPQPAKVINYPGSKGRLNVAQAAHGFGPARPLRLGHIGLFVSDFKRSEAWYCSVLNIRPSDRIYAGAPDHFIGGFHRLDRGSECVDHHVIGFFGMGQPGLHHLSFEVHDIEQQMVAHRWLQKQGHQPVWGVGRHPLGSHVFDMWKDPNGLRFETYSDTDWCNHERAVQDHPVEKSEMDLWSNETPERYFA